MSIKQCTYTIDLGPKSQKTFNLNELTKHYYKSTKQLRNTNIFSSDEIVESTVREIRKQLDRKNDIISKHKIDEKSGNVILDQNGKPIVDVNIIPVSDYLTANNQATYEEIVGLKGQSRLAPEYIEENRILNYIKNALLNKSMAVTTSDTLQTLRDKYPETEKLYQEIKEVIEVEKNTQQLGIGIHKVLNKIVLNEGSFDNSIRSFLKSIITENIDYLEGNIDEWTSKFEDILIQIYKHVSSKGQVLSEVVLRSEPSAIAQVMGSIDIIAVDNSGIAHIYDLKLSKNYYDDWDSAKKLTTDWQLGFYRALLGQYIKVTDSSLNIIPIRLGGITQDSKIDVKNLKLDRIRNRLAEPDGKALLYSNIRTIADDTVEGKLTTSKIYLVANHLIPSKKDISYDPKRNDDLIKDLKLLFPDYNIKVSKKVYDLESMIERAVKNNGFSNNHPGFAHQGATITDKRIYIDPKIGTRYKTDKELEAEYRPLIEKYIDYALKSDAEYVRNLRQKISTALTNKDMSTIEMHSEKEKLFINNALNNYIHGDYQLVGDSEELSSLGLILLHNTRYNSYVLLSITSHNQKSSYDNDSLFRDVEFAKSFLFFNHFKKELDIGINQIENIVVLNPTDIQAPYKDLSNAFESYKEIMSKKGLTNNIKESDLLVTTDRAKILVRQTERDAFSVMSEEDKKKIQQIFGEDQGTIDKVHVHRLKEIIKNFGIHYPYLKTKTFKTDFDYNNIVEKLFAYVQMLLLVQSNIIPIGDFEGLNNFNLRFSSFTNLLGGLFTKNKAEYDANERRIGSIIEGFKTITPDKIKSKDFQNINKLISGTNNHIARKFDHESVIIAKHTRTFYEKTGYDNTQQNWIGNHRKVFKNMWVKDQSGNISKEWKVKNPYSYTEENSMKDEERQYLKNILFMMYKHKSKLSADKLNGINISSQETINDTAPDEMIQAINSGSYFEMPLIRSQQIDRHGKYIFQGVSGARETIKRILSETYDFIDPRELASEDLKNIKSQLGYYEMYDVYAMQSRSFIEEQITKEGENYWELDLDAIAHRFVFSKIRKKHADGILPVINSYVWWMKIRGGMQDDDLSKELEYVANRVKVALFDEHIIDSDFEDVVKLASAAKKLTTMGMLAFRPALLAKELTVGIYKGYSIAVTKMYGGKEQFGVKELNEAIGKLITIDKKFSPEWNLIDSINKHYRLANLDINTIAKKFQTNRRGFFMGLSRWMYATSTIGDYYNRLALFLAKMIKDGSYDAHILSETGHLTYDATKDKRFEYYFKNRDKHKNSKGEYIPAKNDKKYNEQRNLYLLIQDQINTDLKAQGETSLYSENGAIIEHAYSETERESFKSFTDTVYGYYDKDAQAEWHNTWYGVLYLQFLQWWPGKMSMWFGSEYNKELSPIGQHKQKTIKGEDGKEHLVWRKAIENEDGDIIFEETTEDTGDPLIIWEGTPQEGLVYSMMYTLRDIVTGDWANIKNEDLRTRRALYGLSDGFLMFLIFYLISAIFKGYIQENGTDGLDGETIKFMASVNQKVLNEANIYDNTFGALRSKPAFWTYSNKVVGDMQDLFTGDKSFKQVTSKNIRAFEFWDEIQ